MLPRTSVLEFPSLKKTHARRYGAKVKSGCRTCKTRRIKCDEGKPECSRCTSTGRKCGGYASNLQDLVTYQSSSFPNTIPMLSSLGDSIHYLEFYYHCVSSTLASNFDDMFWSRIVLQMSQSEPTVHNAVIALSYLIKTEPGNLKHARAVAKTDNPRTLLLHYNKAVRCLVDRMNDSSYSFEVGLVTCLLFVCIELVRGDYFAAFSHFQSGLKIIAERRQNTPLSPLSSIELSENSNNPRILESNLVPMFIRAIGMGLLFGAPIEPLLASLCPRPQNFEGKRFTSVLEAEFTIYDLRNASIQWILVATRKLTAGAQPTTEEMADHAHLLRCHDSWFQALQILEREGNMSSRDIVVASSLRVSHYSTYVALANAFDIHQTAFDSHISSFKALNYHAKIVLDSMGLPTSSPSSVYPAAMSSSLLSTRGADISTSSSGGPKWVAAHFTFEISLIPPLYFAATRCRCPATRRESVALLARNPPREALWDSEQHTVVARRVIEIEESEVDTVTGRPVQRTRLASALIHRDIDANGGFWVSFMSACWLFGGRSLRDATFLRNRDYDPKRPDSEWDEWFVI